MNVVLFISKKYYFAAHYGLTVYAAVRPYPLIHILRMKILALFYLLFLPLDFSLQDDTKIKQLEVELKQATDQIQKAEILSDISKEYRTFDPKQSIHYGKKAEELAQQTGDKKLLAKAYNSTGAGYFMFGDFENATLKYYAALRLREAIADTAGMCASYNNIGNIFMNQGNYPKALQFYQKALKLSREINDSVSTSRSLNNIGSAYQWQNMPDQALGYYLESLPLKEALKDRDGMSRGLSNIGLIYSQKGDYKKALDYQYKALSIAEEIKSLHNEVYVLRGLADAYLAGRQPRKAVSFAMRSLEKAQQFNSKDEIKQSTELLNAIYTELGDYKNAHFYLTLFNAYKDSVQTEQAMSQINMMQVRYDTEKKELENKRLKADRSLQSKQLEQKTIFTYTIGALLVTALIFVFVTYRGQKRVRLINRKLSFKNSKITQYNRLINEKNGALKEQATQLKWQKEELEHLNELKNRLFSIVAHDLRGPLVSLKSLLQLLAMGSLPEEKLKRFARTLEAEQQNTLYLLDNLLIWARSQMDGANCKESQINIAQLVAENINLLKPQAQRKDILLENKVNSQATALALADDEIIKLVLRNLMSNAIKFCNAGDVVTVEAESDSQFVTVVVRDTGIGIDLNSQEKIFGFRSLTTTGTAMEKGNGLGLALCKDFIEQNGGRIWVESVPGVGSSFSFTLPTARVGEKATPQLQIS